MHQQYVIYIDAAVLTTMRITIESPETLSDENIEEIVDIWNKKIEGLIFELFHYFNFQLHIGFKNLYQNFQGGSKKSKGG